MFHNILMRMRMKIRRNNYVMTIHAEEEMNEEDFTIFDVERAILTGSILERQRDRETGESKYRIRGTAVAGDKLELFAKFSPTDKLVVLTVYTP